MLIHRTERHLPKASSLKPVVLLDTICFLDFGLSWDLKLRETILEKRKQRVDLTAEEEGFLLMWNPKGIEVDDDEHVYGNGMCRIMRIDIEVRDMLGKLHLSVYVRNILGIYV